MKSVMHEASSIAKAIEQAWLKAGQPQEFSVKILEEPQKNFLGFTTRSAKVALFFDHGGAHPAPKNPTFTRENIREGGREKEIRDQPRESYRKPQVTTSPDYNKARKPKELLQERVEEPTRDRVSNSTHNRSVHARPIATTLPEKKIEQKPLQQQLNAIVPSPEEGVSVPKKREFKLLWNDTATQYAQEWLKSTFESMDCSHVAIAITASTPIMHITIKCKAPEYLQMEINKERKVIASISYLLMDALRQKFKTGFKQHKIIIAPEGEQIFNL